jgi:hypothetical protein
MRRQLAALVAYADTPHGAEREGWMPYWHLHAGSVGALELRGLCETRLTDHQYLEARVNDLGREYHREVVQQLAERGNVKALTGRIEATRQRPAYGVAAVEAAS